MKGQVSATSRRRLVDTVRQEDIRAKAARERAKTAEAASARGGGVPSEDHEAAQLRTAAYYHERTARLIRTAAPELFQS